MFKAYMPDPFAHGFGTAQAEGEEANPASDVPLFTQFEIDMLVTSAHSDISPIEPQDYIRYNP